MTSEIHVSSSATPADDHHELLISRFEEGYAPLKLQRLISKNKNNNTNSSGSTTTTTTTKRSYRDQIISCDLLEDSLDDLLDPTIDFPVEYPQPEDALLLHCRFPKPLQQQQQQQPLLSSNKEEKTSSAFNNNNDHHDPTTPIASITGILEEFGPTTRGRTGDNNNNKRRSSSSSSPSSAIVVKMTVYEGTISESTTTANTTNQGPHNSWKRQPMEEFPDPRRRNNLEESLLRVPNDNDNAAAAAVEFMWVDLRSCWNSSSSSNPDNNNNNNNNNTILFPSLTSVAYFFRSLMGTSHTSSPWCPHDDYQKATTTSTSPHRIGILFKGTPPDSIYDVRVGDICPSWFLYSIARLKIPSPKSKSSSVWFPWSGSSSTTTTTLNIEGKTLEEEESATLLIFKRLPPRPLFGLTPTPKVKQDETPLTKLPKGCLWELYFEHQEQQQQDDDDNNNSNNNRDKAMTSSPRKIPHCRMTAPPYLSHLEDYGPNLLQPLVDNWKLIRKEALLIPQWTAWPETQHYSKATNNNRRQQQRDVEEEEDNDYDDEDDDEEEPFHPSWNVFPLCHCFPANQPENKQWIDKTCSFVPQTVQLLKQHLGPVLRTALFSRLDPETTLEAHTGWADLANHVIRCHLPLVVPEGEVCGTWVDGCVETHQEGRFLCFDDSKTHRAFNYSSDPNGRIVLILDLARPTHLPLGTATGGHSDELDQFIAQMNV